MISPLSVILLGFVIGMRHAVDPDHVVAIGTIVSRERSILAAVRAGVFWGVGHCIAIVVAGGTILAFRIAVPAFRRSPDRGEGDPRQPAIAR